MGYLFLPILGTFSLLGGFQGVLARLGVHKRKEPQTHNCWINRYREPNMHDKYETNTKITASLEIGQQVELQEITLKTQFHTNPTP
eukprot:2779025-Amphidinium_carterae.1